MRENIKPLINGIREKGDEERKMPVRVAVPFSFLALQEIMRVVRSIKI
jgi:hypothetical protein